MLRVVVAHDADPVFEPLTGPMIWTAAEKLLLVLLPTRRTSYPPPARTIGVIVLVAGQQWS